MIARVKDTKYGFVLVIPPDYAEAWGLREDFPLEVHRVGHTSEEDERQAIQELHERFLEIYKEILPAHDAAFRELAKGPEGVGPHDPPRMIRVAGSPHPELGLNSSAIGRPIDNLDAARRR
jgi:hypothetical protein